MDDKELPPKSKLKRDLGLGSVIFFIFGYVVGAGILIQTGAVAGQTGPSLWMAFLIAGIPNVIYALLLIYVVSAFPVSGGAWVYSSRLGSPFIGFLVLSSITFHIMGSLALLGVGFGTYFNEIIPGTFIVSSIASILIFYIINLFGVKIAGWIQILLAILGDFLVILIFIIFGLPRIDPSKLLGISSGGMFPTGFIGIFIGAIVLSFSYGGFSAITEIGGEIKNPRRNIPLGLVISFIMVVVVYILASIVMTGTIDWQTLGAIEGTFIDVGRVFFPEFFIPFLIVLILIAIASTIHGILLSWSRDLFSAARDCMVPTFLAKVNNKYKTPHWSLTFFAVGSIIILILQASIIDLSFFASTTMSIAGVVLSYIPLTLEKRFPELVEKSKFKISRKVLIILVVINLAYNAFSIIVTIAVAFEVIFLVLIFYVLAIIYYIVRKFQLQKRGVNLKEVCKTIPEETLELDS
jgi:APA family basic amino acid/polyamine antiporter